MDLSSSDALSAILNGLRLRAEVYVHADFCGAWALDTSGNRHVPFHLVERGTSWLHLPEQAPQLLRAGQLVVFPHDAGHVLSSQADAPDPAMINQPARDTEGEITTLVCGFFEFGSKTAWPLLDSLPQVIVLDLNDSQRFGDSGRLIQLLITELQHAKPGVSAVVNQLAYVLFIHILRSQIALGTGPEQQGGLQSGLLAALFDPHIGPALSLIHNAPEKNWSVERLAGEVGMSRAVFAERFKTVVTQTPMRYLTEWRMREATEQLLQTDRSILAIAEACGYRSEVAFRKAFRAVTGKTPGAIRKSRNT